jgi:hypothetical protein
MKSDVAKTIGFQASCRISDQRSRTLADPTRHFFPFFPASPGGVGGRAAWSFANLALCLSPVPDDVFFGFLSPMLVNSLATNTLFRHSRPPTPQESLAFWQGWRKAVIDFVDSHPNSFLEGRFP